MSKYELKLDFDSITMSEKMKEIQDKCYKAGSDAMENVFNTYTASKQLNKEINFPFDKDYVANIASLFENYDPHMSKVYNTIEKALYFLQKELGSFKFEIHEVRKEEFYQLWVNDEIQLVILSSPRFNSILFGSYFENNSPKSVTFLTYGELENKKMEFLKHMKDT